MLQGSQIVNRLGKYLNKHIAGSGSIENRSNTCIVSIPILYTVIPDNDALQDGNSQDVPNETGTLTVHIYIKTYDNRIAISILNGDINIDFKTYTIASFDDYETQCLRVLNNSKTKICRKYPQYDFQFDSL